MATREGSVEGLKGVERFDALLQEIEEKFSHFHSLLETQRMSLLERVRKMKGLYQEHQDMSKAIQELKSAKRAVTDMLTSNLVALNKDEILKMSNDKIDELKQKKSKLERISFLKLVLNDEEFIHCIKRIHLREIQAEEYSARREPFVMKGKIGEGVGEVITPRGVTIDDTRKEVYVADFSRYRTSIYSLKGDFIKEFGGEHLNGPYGICAFGEYLFVSGSSNSVIYKFNKTGAFEKGTSLEEVNAVQLDGPTGLCVHNELLYVANRINKRIGVLNLDLKFVKNFGEDKLQSPEDIKIFNNEIFVLTQLDNTIHTFCTKHNYLRSIHFTGQQNQISQAFFFTIDNKGNFIVSDRDANCLKVFSSSGEYVETLGEGYLILPQGVAINDQQRIFVINLSDYKCFQIY